jgi:hypothetical protein
LGISRRYLLPLKKSGILSPTYKIRKKTLKKEVLHEGDYAQKVEEAARKCDEPYEEIDDHIGTHFKKI